MKITNKEYKDIETLLTLLERLDRGDYFNEDDDKFGWRDALHRIQENFYALEREGEK